MSLMNEGVLSVGNLRRRTGDYCLFKKESRKFQMCPVTSLWNYPDLVLNYSL